jgi:hypothetical protein
LGRWQRYWFSDGGRTAAAVVRIAIACSVLLTLARLDNAVSTSSTALYRPVGIWMLAGDAAPPDLLVGLLWLVAWVATAGMLVGLATRASTAVSFVASVALASLAFASSRTWSHQYNVVFLAQLAFLGARGGDVLSFDRWIRSRRGLPAADEPRAYQWSLRLVQLAVALMFAGAVFHKLLHGQFTLRWALSDNLRNHLLVKFDLAGLPRPPLVDWLLAEPWRYQTAAMLNLLSQALPLAAVFLVNRPRLRALAGAFFVIETIALGLVVDLWNLHWLPLAAVFVDWDRLIARVRREPRAPVSSDVDPPPTWRPKLATRIWIIAFIAYDIVTAFVPTLDQRLNTYPFSGFPMFSTVRVRPPYDQHLPYGVAADYFEITSDKPADQMVQRWFDHANRGAHAIRDRDQLERRMRAVLANAQKRFPDFGIRAVRLWLAIYETPAYPAPPEFERYPIAVMGELAADGTFRSVLGTLRGTPGPQSEAWVRLAPKNVAVADAELAFYADDHPRRVALPAVLSGDTFAVGYQDLSGNPIYFVAIIAGVPWLAAVYAPWRWQ